MDELDEVVGEFLVESYENLDRYDEDLLALEQAPTDTELLDSIFRTVHTIKGTCGFFGFEQVQSLSHVAENLLGKLRERELLVSNDITSALLATGDALRGLLADIESTGAEGDSHHGALIRTLERLQAGSHAGAVGAAWAAEHAPDVAGDLPEEPGTTPSDAPGGHRLGDMLIEEGLATPADVERALHAQHLGDKRPLGAILIDQAQVPAEDIRRALAYQASARSLTENSIRVDVTLLDEVIDLVGEVALARDAVVSLAEAGGALAASAAGRLDAATMELQHRILRMRMQPIGNVWNKLPRLVRDLALASRKQIDLVMEGQDTELDKTVIEAIKDPLTHLVRNAIDHGIESADDRLAQGKRLTGQIVVRACRSGSDVNLEVVDDGAGIDAHRLKTRAVELELITVAEAAEMNEEAALQLIFAAGFSTATQVTNVSGRGVGMDVVRTNVDRIGGSIDVTTSLGAGTTVRLMIPATNTPAPTSAGVPPAMLERGTP